MKLAAAEQAVSGAARLGYWSAAPRQSLIFLGDYYFATPGFGPL